MLAELAAALPRLTGQDWSGGEDRVLAPVRQGDLVETFVFHGEMEACDSVQVHAPELQETRLVTIRSVLEDGTPVQASDTVVELEDGDFQRALEGARDEVEVAQAELEKVRFDLQNDGIDLELNVKRRELELEKARAMVIEDAIVFSKIELQKAKLGVEQAEMELKYAQAALGEFRQKREATLKVKELQLQQARRKIDIQQENISRSVIRAPGAGIVYKPFIRLNNEMGRIEAGKVVRCGDKLLELPNLDRFRGVSYVPTVEYPYLTPGSPATLTLTIAPDRVFPAVLESKEPYPISRNERLGRNDPEGFLKEYKVSFALSGTDPVFRPGLTFKAEIATVIATGCTFLPRAALARPNGDRATVWMQAPGGAVERQIRTGRKGVAFIEVLEGLRPGDQVCLDFPLEEEGEDEDEDL
ncbi:MAG: hypothetical protein GX442_22200 [Candidatus Riflebacteria bacterium]|nr:hypothetical protein [Candidatus Riflebacteria bacterium]